MAINGPNPLSGVEGSRVTNLPTSADRAGAPPREDGGGGTRFDLTSDLVALLASVRQSSEVRQEVIGEAARRLASGELFTRAATEKTVEGVLASNALGGF